MKDRKDFIPAVNGIIRGEKITQARGRVAKILIEQGKGARTEVVKIFEETQVAFWDKCNGMDKMYED